MKKYFALSFTALAFALGLPLIAQANWYDAGTGMTDYYDPGSSSSFSQTFVADQGSSSGYMTLDQINDQRNREAYIPPGQVPPVQEGCYRDSNGNFVGDNCDGYGMNQAQDNGCYNQYGFWQSPCEATTSVISGTRDNGNAYEIWDPGYVPTHNPGVPSAHVVPVVDPQAPTPNFWSNFWYTFVSGPSAEEIQAQIAARQNEYNPSNDSKPSAFGPPVEY